MNYKKILLGLVLLLGLINIVSAVPGDEIWNATYDSGDNDYGRSIAIDSADNVYVTGYSYNGANYDYVTKVYDSSGTLINTLTFDGGGTDVALGVAIDSADNVYVTGYGYNGVNNDYVTKVYDSSGTLINTLTFDSGDNDYGSSIAIDSADNVYVTGYSYNGANYDMVTKVYDSSGTLINTLTFDSGGTDVAYGVAIDSAGNVYVTGYSYNGANNDYITKVYDSSGTLINTLTFDGGGTDIAYGVAIDSAGNVYVTGYSYNGANDDMVTKVYDSSGTLINTLTFDGGGTDYGRGVAIDSADNVYVTGNSYNGANYDYYTIKYEGYPISNIVFQNITGITNNAYYNTNYLTIDIELNTTNTNNDTNVSYSLDGNSYIQFITNSLTGTLNLTSLSDGTHNLTFFAWNNETNVTSDTYTFTIDTTNPSLSVALPSEYNYYTGFNFSQYINVSDTNLDTCIITISGESSTTCTEENYTFTTNGNKTINITATDLAGNTNSSLNNIILINPYQYFYFYDTDNSQYITNFTFGGTLFENFAQFTTYNDVLVLGNNSFEFSKLGYPTQTFSFVVNETSQINQTFNTSTAKINVEIRDKRTGDIITGTNFTLEFIATIGLVDYTTTGVLNVSNTFFKDEEYRLIVTGSGYETESIFFDFTNREILDLDVYMVNSSVSNLGFVIIDVVNRFDKPIEDVIVKALQWDSATSSYITVSEAKTNSLGSGTLNIILEDKLYKFRAVQNGNFAETVDMIISTSENGQRIPIVLSDIVSETKYLLENVVFDISESFDNTINTSTINVSWEDLDGLDQTVCINSFRIVNSNLVKLSNDSTNCLTSASNTLEKNFLINSSYDIVLKVQAKIDGNYIDIEEFTYYSNTHISEVLKSLNLDFLMVTILNIISISLGLFFRNVYIGSILLMFAGIFSLIILPNVITSAIAAFYIFIGIVTIIGGKER
jgi:hypothetical protein